MGVIYASGCGTTPVSPNQEPGQRTETTASKEAKEEPIPTRPDEPTQPQPEPAPEPNTQDAGDSMEPAPEPTPVPDVVAEVPPEPIPDVMQGCAALPSGNIEATWKYARSITPEASGMIVRQNGSVIYETYAAIPPKRNPVGGAKDEVYSMFSQTKSLTGLAALLLVKQGKLTLQDRVSKYIPSWLQDENKKKITIRELLTLSSGIATKVSLPGFIRLSTMINAPFVKKQFAYGSAPFIVFAAIIQKIMSESAQSFLDRELFAKLNIKIQIGTTIDISRTTNLASGGTTTLRDMAILGQELVDAARGKGKVFDRNDMLELMKPGLNPSYGLTVWLNASGSSTSAGSSFSSAFSDCGPQGGFHLLGAGGQVLTIIPEKALLLAKSASTGSVQAQANDTLWSTFFKGSKCQCGTP